MIIAERVTGRALVLAGLTVAVFVVVAPLAQLHVGRSVFLSDQADQLQFFERFLRGEPAGLWGPIMSSPNPPTRSLGPLGGWLFGIPVALGFGVDAVQAVTSAALVAATFAAFVALARAGSSAAWVWLLLVLANGIVWWNAATLWANTALLPLGHVLLACMVWCLAAPTLARLAAMLLVLAFAAHISLVAIAAIPPVALVAVRTLRPAWARPPRGAAAVALAVAAVLAIAPYLIAEVMTGFANTRAILSHAGGQEDETLTAAAYALPVLQHAADPGWLMQRAGIGGWSAVAIGTAVALAALALGLYRRRPRARRDEAAERRDDVLLWLVLTAVVAAAGQAAFFALQKRTLLSYHYVSLLLPLYAVPPAALAAWLVAALPPRVRTVAPIVLGAGCLLVVWRHAETWAYRYAERTDWTYTRIATAVDELCGEAGSARVAEGPGFASVMPGHDGVVAYLMTRRFVRCRLDPAADQLVAASREGNYPDVREDAGSTFQLVTVVDPGLALYRRESAAP